MRDYCSEFVHRENLRRLEAQLEQETDPSRQAVLDQLLHEEQELDKETSYLPASQGRALCATVKRPAAIEPE